MKIKHTFGTSKQNKKTNELVRTSLTQPSGKFSKNHAKNSLRRKVPSYNTSTLYPITESDQCPDSPIQTYKTPPSSVHDWNFTI